MTDDRLKTLDLLIKEMTAAWAYLHGYAELFEHPDQRRVQLLEETAPGFFSLVEAAFVECMLIRLVRLMDPPESRNKKDQNLSFGSLFCPCGGNPDLTEAKAQFGKICRDWKGPSSKYRTLKNYRDKVHSHNDLSTIKGAPPWVTSKLTTEEIQLLKELFCRLWEVLRTANNLFKGIALGEPSYKTLKQLPTAIFGYLSGGHYIEKAFVNHFELLGEYMESEFHGVGHHDKMLRIIP